MFTGIVEETGKAVAINRSPTGARLILQAPTISRGIRIGESIAVNGCCLTVVEHIENNLSFDLLGETLERTTLGNLEADALVNLERSLAADGRLGGHFVQGHIDTVSPVISFEKINADYRLEISLPSDFSQYVAYKGSIAINGVSLTVAELSDENFVVWIIPHTHSTTNFKQLITGESVNLEFDMLAKYVARIVDKKGSSGNLMADR